MIETEGLIQVAGLRQDVVPGYLSQALTTRKYVFRNERLFAAVSEYKKFKDDVVYCFNGSEWVVEGDY